MSITPTKSRTAAKAEKVRTPNIPALRDAWCDLIPEIDTNALGTTDAEQAKSLPWIVAGYARLFMEWTHFQPTTWQPPAQYTSHRLARICAWLGSVQKKDAPYRREDALKILLAAWDRLTALDSDIFWHTVFTLWTADEEFGPLTENLEFLPKWDTEDPDPRAAAAATTAEEFALYSGLVTYLNAQIGKGLLDLEPDPF